MNTKKVMIVDDDGVFLKELADLLAACGYGVIPVREPASVVRTAQRKRPDVILLDLKMQGKDGFDVVEELSRSRFVGRIPVIGMSGVFNERQNRFLVRLFGLPQVLAKPFFPLDVISRIEFST